MKYLQLTAEQLKAIGFNYDGTKMSIFDIISPDDFPDIVYIDGVFSMRYINQEEETSLHELKIETIEQLYMLFDILQLEYKKL